MRKIYLLLFVCMFLGSYAQNVNFGTSLQFRNRILSSSAGAGIAYNSSGAHMKVDVNNDGQIQLTEALEVWEIRVEDATSMQGMTGLNSFINLRVLEIDQTGVTTLNIQALVNLETVIIYDNFTSLTLNGLPNLKNINIQQTSITSLNLTGLPSLETAIISYNNINTPIDVSQSPDLIILDAGYNHIPSVNLVGAVSLQNVNFINNMLQTINLSGLVNLIELNVLSNSLDVLDVSEQVNLKKLSCGGNQLTQLDIQPLQNLEYLYCHNNDLTSLNPQGLIHLVEITCSNNEITSLNVQGLTNLYNLSVANNNLTTLDVHGLLLLKFLYAQNNDLATVNVTNLTSLDIMHLENNQLTQIELYGLDEMGALFINDNLLSTLDISLCPSVGTVKCFNNQLTTMFLKNGHSETIDFTNNPNLTYICADTAQILNITSKLAALGYINVELNAYCADDASMSTTILGQVTFYPTQDTTIPGQSVNAVKISVPGHWANPIITDNQGNFSYLSYQSSGVLLMPIFENPALFNSFGAYYIIEDGDEVVTVDIDITPSYPATAADIEAIITPLGNASPGSDLAYKLTIRNKGNKTGSGTLNLSFDDGALDFATSDILPSSSDSGILTWSFTNLPPLNSQDYTVTFTLNSQTDAVPIANGYILSYQAIATLSEGSDYLPADNSFTYNQVVTPGPLPSFSKECIQGAYIKPADMGEYINYVIRFENNGPEIAQKVIVRDIFEQYKFDTESLIPISASHVYTTQITGDIVEFIFDNINLPADDANNDGYIAFKIKTMYILDGDVYANNAKIYFDYNYNQPYTTNTAITQVAALPTSLEVTTLNSVPATITSPSGTLQLTATVLPATAGQMVSWTIVSGSEYATVNSSGLITATANGIVTIKAINLQVPTMFATIQVTVSGQIIPAESVSVSVTDSAPAVITIDNGTLQLAAAVLPAEADQNVTWSIVSGSEFATISETGLVTATHNGTVTVQAASVQNPAVIQTLEIVISGQIIPAESLSVSVADNAPAVITTDDGTLQLVTVVLPAEADQNVTWSIVSGSEFATISETGLVTATHNGTVTVQAASVQNPTVIQTLEIVISGQVIPVESVTVSVADNAPALITTDDGTLQLVAAVLPADADQNVAWSIISGSEYATIDENGVVEAIGNGLITVQATSINFPSVSGNIQIEITGQEVPIESITVTVSDGEPLTITVPGGTLQLVAVVLPAEANQNVIWTIISGSEFATITESGLITAIANGTIVVQAQSGVTSPDGRNSNIIFDTIEIIITGQSLNVVETEQENFIIYPNPASDVINIQSAESIIQSVEIYNSLGQSVLIHSNNSRHASVNVSALSNGMYILKVKSPDGTCTYRFVKK